LSAGNWFPAPFLETKNNKNNENPKNKRQTTKMKNVYKDTKGTKEKASEKKQGKKTNRNRKTTPKIDNKKKNHKTISPSTIKSIMIIRVKGIRSHTIERPLLPIV
jgi:hypothetical protein